MKIRVYVDYEEGDAEVEVVKSLGYMYPIEAPSGLVIHNLKMLFTSVLQELGFATWQLSIEHPADREGK